MPLPKRSQASVDAAKAASAMSDAVKAAEVEDVRLPRLELTDRMIEAIGHAIELGNYPHQAAALSGVSKRIFDGWFKEGRHWQEDETRFASASPSKKQHARKRADLVREVDRAQASSALHL